MHTDTGSGVLLVASEFSDTSSVGLLLMPLQGLGHDFR